MATTLRTAFTTDVPPNAAQTDVRWGVLAAYALWFAELAGDSRLSHWALVLDHQDPSFRHHAFAAYKGHRPPMAEDLREQLRVLPKLAEIFGITTWQVRGVEADDTLASLAEHRSRPGPRCGLQPATRTWTNC